MDASYKMQESWPYPGIIYAPSLNIIQQEQAMHTSLIALVLCATAISGAAADGVVNYRIPSFNTTTTTVSVRVATNSSVYTLDPGRHDPELDRSEGFLLLAPRVVIWRAGVDGKPPFQASFNSSFAVGGVKPIAFVLFDSIPFGGGEENIPLYASANVTGVAEVQVGPVRSIFHPDGLNVTVTPETPRGGEVAVWIEYRAIVQSLSVYVGNGSQTKPSKPVVNTTINLSVWWPQTTNETQAYTGFYAGTIRDVISGVRDWNLTVDKLPEESVATRNKGTPWLVVLLTVFGSAVTMSFI